jgi:hypothetical protein
MESKAASLVQLSHCGKKLPWAVCWEVVGRVSSGPGVSKETTEVETAVPSVPAAVGKAAVKAKPEKRHTMRALNIFMMKEAKF